VIYILTSPIAKVFKVSLLQQPSHLVATAHLHYDVPTYSTLVHALR